MANSDIRGADWFEVAAWALGIPGLILSYWTAIAYIPQVRQAVAAGASVRSSSVSADT
jgi:cardiolipin synthase (CMP-forming)